MLRCVTKVRGYIQKAESAIIKDSLFKLASNNPLALEGHTPPRSYAIGRVTK